MCPQSESPFFSVVVANWNGEKYLEAGVQSLFDSGRASGLPFEVIVVDDASTDGSLDLLRQRFPQVQILANTANQGFAATSNRGAEAARGQYVVMINNDVVVPRDFMENILAAFREAPAQADPPLFAVGARTVEMDDPQKPNHICMYPAWRRGGLGKDYCDPSDRRENSYAQGGAAAYCREMFLALGGFDPFFKPGYWEDYDLSYRALLAGWRSIYDPAAEARHAGKGSLGPLLGDKGIERLDERNRLFFNWLNLEDARLWVRHLLGLFWVYGRDLFRPGGCNRFAGFLDALRALPRVRSRRRERRLSSPPARASERQIMGVRGILDRKVRRKNA